MYEKFMVRVRKNVLSDFFCEVAVFKYSGCWISFTVDLLYWKSVYLNVLYFIVFVILWKQVHCGSFTWKDISQQYDSYANF